MSAPYTYYSKAVQASTDMKRVLHRVYTSSGKRYGEPLVAEKRKDATTGKETEVKVRRAARAQRPSGRARHDLWTNGSVWTRR